MTTKEKRADEILENDTYLPESGLVRRLKSQLLRLSADDLANLKMIFDLKLESARTGDRVDHDEVRRPCPRCGADLEQYGIGERPNEKCTACGHQ